MKRALTILVFLLLACSCYAQVTTSGSVISGANISTTSNTLTITTTALPNADFGSAYGPVSLSATGGIGTLSWAPIGGSLPPGITLSSAGVLSGTATLSGNYTFTVQVTDQNPGTPQMQQATLSISVSCAPLSIPIGSPLPDGNVGSLYSSQLPVSGGQPPFRWSLLNNGLPAGISLDPSGVVNGTPTTAGTCLPQFQVVDSCTPPQTSTGTLSLTINPAGNSLAISTTSPLPTAIKNQLYQAQLVATGGTQPYTWTITVGALPAGLSMNSAGLITGTPTVVGTTSGITFHVVDNAAATADLVGASITVLAPAAGDNRYCGPNEVFSDPKGPTDGPAALPQTCVYTPMSAMAQSTPVTKTVCPAGQTIGGIACDFPTIQQAFNAAACGWTIKIKAVNGTTQNVYNEALTTSTTCPKTNWIIVETDQLGNSNFPSEGTRITPCAINKAALTGRPPYVCANPAFLVPKVLSTATAAAVSVNASTSHWRFIGIEFTSPSTAISYGRKVMQLGGPSGSTSADHIVVDRILCHGGDDPNGQSGQDGSGCTAVAGLYIAIVDSYVYDTHCIIKQGSVCTDSQAVLGGGGDNPQGPIKVVNNFLESSGETWLWGGGRATIVPNDLELRRNHSYKPSFWQPCFGAVSGTSTCGTQSIDNPLYAGIAAAGKNNGELKNANRVLVEGNIFEYNWAFSTDQQGSQMLLSPKNQSSFVQLQATSDGAGNLTYASGTQHFTALAVDPGCTVPNQCRVIFNGTNYLAQTFTDTSHISVAPNPPAGGPFATKQCQPGLDPGAITTNVVVRYNRFLKSSRGIEIFSAQSDCGDFGQGIHNVSVHDNAFDEIDGLHYAKTLGSNCCKWSIGLRITNGNANGTQTHDISVFHNTILPLPSGGGAGTMGGLNFDTNTVAMFNMVVKDNLMIGSPKDASVSGSQSIPTMMAGIDPTNSWCIQGNVWTTGDFPGMTNDTPNTTSPGCPGITTPNQTATTQSLVGYVNYANATAGDYRLCHGVNNPTSACTGASQFMNDASDGRDPGVDMNLLNQAISGVQ